MGFASGSLTCRRFFMVGKHPTNLTDDWRAAIDAHAFGRHAGAAGVDGVQIGWIRPTHVFDVDFDDASAILAGRFVHLGLRIDRTAAPPAVVRGYQRQEEAAALEASGREFLTKSEWRLAKEAAQLRAEQEARDGAFRRISACGVIIDLADGVVYLGQAGVTAGDRLAALFNETFNVTLAPCSAGELAARLLERAGRPRALDDLTPCTLADDGEVAEAGAAAGWADGGWLGREFLTWLWFHVDTGEGAVHGADGLDVSAAAARTVRLECPFGVTGTTTVRADAPLSLPETRTALAAGKMPTRLGLMLAARSDEWSFTLDAARWTLSGVALPESDEAEAAARTEERCMRLRELTSVLDALFAAFLRQRTAASWPADLDRIRRWAATRSATVLAGASRRASA